MKQGLVIFQRRGTYSRTVLGWQVVHFTLELATLYLLLRAFGFVGATITSVILIRTAQRVTASLPGFLETGSQQAMIVAILSRGTHGVGHAFGFGFGSKVTTAAVDVTLALIAARIMVGPLRLRARIGAKLKRKPVEPDVPQPALGAGN